MFLVSRIILMLQFYNFLHDVLLNALEEILQGIMSKFQSIHLQLVSKSTIFVIGDITVFCSTW